MVQNIEERLLKLNAKTFRETKQKHLNILMMTINTNWEISKLTSNNNINVGIQKLNASLVYEFFPKVH